MLEFEGNFCPAEVIILLIKRPDDLSTAPVHGGAMGSIIYVWFRREIIPLVFTIQNNYSVTVISPVGIITKCCGAMGSLEL